MAAPAFGTIGTLHGATTSTPAFAVPASVASGNIIVVAFFADATNTTISAFPTGFAEAQNSPVAVTGGTMPHTLHVAWKRATGADSGTYTFTLSASVFVYGNAVRYTSCVAAGNPWDAPTASGANTAATNTATPDVAVTTLGPDRLLFFAGTDWSGDSGTWSAPTSFSQRQGGTNTTNCEISDLIQAGQGGSGNVHATHTVGGSVASWLGALIGTTVAGSVPYTPPMFPQFRDAGQSYFEQRDRRNANLVATAANPLASPLDSAWQAGARYWHLYGDIAQRFTIVPYTQGDRRDANRLATIDTDPLTLANGVGGDTWRRYNSAATLVDRREVPQQRAYVSNPLLLTTAELENELLGSADDLRRYYLQPAYYDRREVPQQRAYVSDPLLLTTAELENELLGSADDLRRRYLQPVSHSARWWMPEQPKRDGYTPGLLDSALVENELLGGAETAKRYLLPGTHVDRREVPQQRAYVSDPLLLTTAQLENGLLGGAGTSMRANVPATHAPRWWMPEQPNRQSWYFDAGPDSPPLTLSWGVDGRYSTLYSQPAWQPDRREVPQQRAYISDPSFYPTVAPTDPLTVAWGAGGTYWLVYNTATQHADRREVPQQRAYVSDPLLLTTAQLENELLGSVDDRWRRYGQWFTDRREVPQQRAYVSDPNLLGTTPADPLTLAAGVGGDTWRRYALPAYADRREVPQQRAYVSDLTLLPQAADPLLLTSDTWRRWFTPAYADRCEVPQQPPRWQLYFDAGPGTPPLTLAWGAGGSYWHRPQWRREARSWWPPRLIFSPLGNPCTTLRPTLGVIANSIGDITSRPSTGTTLNECHE